MSIGRKDSLSFRDVWRFGARHLLQCENAEHDGGIRFSLPQAVPELEAKNYFDWFARQISDRHHQKPNIGKPIRNR